MSGVLSSAFFFVVAIGVLVTVHEYGHFVVARALGVRVLRFSVGFGKPLWSWRRGPEQTEYVIAVLPLGGYVQMLDEREGPVPHHELHRAFNRKSLGRRAAIVAAGPLFNFLLAIVAYWLVFVAGVAGIKPMVGEIAEGSIAAQGGFRNGDLIVSIDRRPVATWNTAFLELLDRGLSRRRVAVEVVDADDHHQERVLDFGRLAPGVDRSNLLANAGFDLYRPALPAVLGRLEPDGAAEKAGLRPGDRVVEADGHPVADWDDWVKVVRDHAGTGMAVAVEREGKTVTIDLRPERAETPEGAIGRIGAAPQIPAGFGEDLQAVERYSAPAALAAAVQRTWGMVRLTVDIMASMVSGNVGVSNLGGPLRIAQYAGSSADAGLVPFISFIALISISLGVLNLLPVPVLDGGHLLYYLIELVKGRPLSDEAQMFGQKIGVVLLVGIMVLAFYNDIVQLVG